MTQFSYQVLFDPTNVSPTDITEFCQRVEWNEVGTGEVRNGTIRLNAQDGQFITSDTSLAGKSTPIIKQFDQISIGITDRNLVSRKYVFEVDTLKPIENTQVGTVLEVDLLGLENQLMKVMFAKPFLEQQGGANAFTVARDIIDFYNDPNSKGPNQPLVIGNDNMTRDGGFNDLPKFTSNPYHFELSEQSAYVALDIVADRMGSSVPSGGAGDFFEIYFKTSSADESEIEFHGFISGNPPDQQVDNANGDYTFNPQKSEKIFDTTSINPGEEEGGIEAIKGNVTGTWGTDGVGTLPRQNARFTGSLELWSVFPFYDDTITYEQDAIVQINTQDVTETDFLQHYKANTRTTGGGTPPSANWDLFQFSDYLTQNSASGLYSLWTNNRASEWKSCGAKVDGTTGAIANDPPTLQSIRLWDSNQVVIDGTFARTWVDTAQTDPSGVPTQLLYPNRNYYRGFRVLVNGVGTGAYTGFGNLILQYFGNLETDFRVFRTPNQVNFVADDDEGRIFQFQNTGWIDIDTTDKAVDCYHPYIDVGLSQGALDTDSFGGGEGATATPVIDVNGQVSSITVTNGGSGYTASSGIDVTIAGGSSGNNARASATVVGGIITAITVDDGGGRYNNVDPPSVFISDRGGNFGGFSAVTNEFRFSQNDIGQGFFNSSTYYRIGAWLNFRVPFPSNTFNNNTLGELYGTENSKYEPVTFDTTNMHFSPDGSIGFNHDQADNLGPLDALTFFTKFNWNYQKDGSGSATRTANYACRCWMVDTSDNVVIQDFTIPFNGEWAQITLPVSEFKIYRGRTPVSFANIGSLVFLQKLEVLQRFEFFNIQKIGMQWLGSYDDDGRYNPVFNGGKALFPSIEDQFYAALVLISPIFAALSPIDGFNIKWSVDSFQWNKAGLVVSDPVTTETPDNLGRSIQPSFFEEPLISNIIQLTQANEAHKDLANFQQTRYDVVTEGILLSDFGDSFYLKNSFLVNTNELPVSGLEQWLTGVNYSKGSIVQNQLLGFEAINSHTSSLANEPPSAEWIAVANPVPNTIKLVAKRINYVIDKPPTGSGGFLRTIEGAKRIE